MALQLLSRPYRPLARHSHLAWSDNKKLYLWGGCVEGQLPGHRLLMHAGDEKMKLVTSLEVLNIEEGVWRKEKIHGSNPPLGIRDCALALLKSSTGTERLRPFVFGGFCGHEACLHNSLHELCFDSERERYEWSEKVANNARGCPLKKRGAAAVAFAADGREQVCVFAGCGPANSAPRQQASAEYYPPRISSGALCWTNEIHFLDITDTERASWMKDVKVTGESPPPCWDCSFIKGSDNDPRAVLFGGECPNIYSSAQKFRWHDDVYMLNLKEKHWETISPSMDPWPVFRTRHASCLVAGPLTGHNNTVLLTMGGADIKDVTQNDAHLMDLTNKTTLELDVPSEIACRQWHSITSVPIDEHSVYVVVVGGVQNRAATDPSTWPRIKEDFILRFAIQSTESDKEGWKWIQSETTSLADLGYAQLRHELDNVKKELTELKQRFQVPLPVGTPAVTLTSLDKLPEGKLGPNDLADVLIYMEEQGCVSHWKRIGVRLHLPHYDMEVIEKDYDGGVECMMAMLDQWLETGQATKQALMDALKRIR